MTDIKLLIRNLRIGAERLSSPNQTQVLLSWMAGFWTHID